MMVDPGVTKRNSDFFPGTLTENRKQTKPKQESAGHHMALHPGQEPHLPQATYSVKSLLKKVDGEHSLAKKTLRKFCVQA